MIFSKGHDGIQIVPLYFTFVNCPWPIPYSFVSTYYFVYKNPNSTDVGTSYVIWTLQSPPEDDGYSCWGGSHNVDDIINAMYNWHRALCAQKEDAAWNGVYDPAYM